MKTMVCYAYVVGWGVVWSASIGCGCLGRYDCGARVCLLMWLGGGLCGVFREKVLHTPATLSRTVLHSPFARCHARSSTHLMHYNLGVSARCSTHLVHYNLGVPLTFMYARIWCFTHQQNFSLSTTRCFTHLVHVFWCYTHQFSC